MNEAEETMCAMRMAIIRVKTVTTEQNITDNELFLFTRRKREAFISDYWYTLFK